MARTATATTSLAQVAWCINRIEGLKSEVDELDVQVVQDVEDYHALQCGLFRLEKLRSVELSQRCRGIELDSQTLDAGPSRLPSSSSSHGLTQLSEKARGKLRSNTDELAERLIVGQRQFERDLKRVDEKRRRRAHTPPNWGQEAASLLERVLSLQWRDCEDRGDERRRRGAKETQQRLVEGLLEDHTILPTIISAVEASGGPTAVLYWAEGLVVTLLSSSSLSSASKQREVDDLILALLDALHQTRLSILATTSADQSNREASGSYFDPLRPTRKLELALLGFVGRERAPTSLKASPLKSPLTMKKPQPLPPQYLPSSTIVHLRQRTVSTPTQPPPPAMSSFSVLGNSASQLWNDTTSTLSGFFGSSTPSTAQPRSVSLGLPTIPNSESESEPEEGKENENSGKNNDGMQVKKGGRQRVVSMTTAGSPPQRILPLSNVDEDDAKASFSSFANGSDARTALGHLSTPSMVLDRRRRARVISDAQQSQVDNTPTQQQQTPPRQRTSSLINKSQIVKLSTPVKSPTKAVIDESEGGDSQEDDIWVERILAVLAPSSASQSDGPVRVPLVIALARRLLQHHFDAQNHAAMHRRLALIIVVRWFGFTQLRSLLTRPDSAGRSLRHPSAPLRLGGGLLSKSGSGQENDFGETSDEDVDAIETDEGPQTATMEGVWMPQLADDLDALHRRVYQAITRVMDAGRETGAVSDKETARDEVARRIVEAFGVGVDQARSSSLSSLPKVEYDEDKISSGKNGAIAAISLDRVDASNLVRLLSPVDECEDKARCGQESRNKDEVTAIFFARQDGKILVDVSFPSIEARMARRRARGERKSGAQSKGQADNFSASTSSNPSAAVNSEKGQARSVLKPRSASVTTNGINSHVFPSSSTTTSGSVLSVASNSSSGTATYGNGAAAASSSSRMERTSSNSSWGSPPSSPYHQGLAGASGVGYFDLELGGNTPASPTSPVTSPLQRRVSASRSRAPPTAWRAMGAVATVAAPATIASPLPIESASTSVSTASETVLDEASLPLDEIRKGIVGLVRGPYKVPLHRHVSLFDALSMAADTARRSFAHDDAALLDQTRDLIVETEPAARKVILDLLVKPLRTSLAELQRRKARREGQRWRVSRQRVRLLEDATSVYARMHELRARAWYASEVRLAMGVRRARQVALDNLLLSSQGDNLLLTTIPEKKSEREEDVETGRDWLARQAIYDMGLQLQYDVDYLRDLDRAFSDIIAGDAASFFASSKVWMREEALARPYMLGPGKPTSNVSVDGEGSNPASDEDVDEATDEEGEVVLGFGACSRRMLPTEQRRTERRKRGKSIQALEDFLQRVQLLVTGLFLSEAMVPLQQAMPNGKQETGKTMKEEEKDQEHGPNDEVARRILASSGGKEGLDELLCRFERHPSPREKMRCALVVERLVVTHLEAHRRQVTMQKRLALKVETKPQSSLRQTEDPRHQRRLSRAGTDSTPMRPLSVQSSLNGTGRPRRALSMYGDDDWEQQVDQASPLFLPNLPIGQVPPLGIDDVLAQLHVAEDPLISPTRSHSESQQQTSYDSDSSSSSSSVASASTVTAAAAVAATDPSLEPAHSLSSTRAESETQQGYAPSTDDIVATLESLLRLRRLQSSSSSTTSARKDSERDMRLALQIVAAFTPTDVLDRRDEGKAFWDLALAALAATSDTA